VSLNLLGDLALQEGDRAGARAAFEESLGIARDLAARFGTPGDLNGWVWSAQKCAGAMIQQSRPNAAGAILSECRDAVDSIAESSDVRVLDTAAAWWERWCEVHEAMGDQSTADDARTRAAALRNRIEAMKAASGDGDSGGASEGD
jgi:hypothetical protein